MLLEPEKAEETVVVEKKAETAKKKQEPFPIALAVLLVVFGIAAGIIIQQVFLQKPSQLPQDAANRGTFEETPIELTVIYNSDCNICFRESSLETLLKQKSLKFSVERLDMKIRETGILAGQNGMTTFPSSLLNWKQLKLADPELYKILKTMFQANGDYFVIPETELMKETQLYSPIMFLEAPTKERCGVKTGTAKLTAFFDFFSDNSFKAQSLIESLKKNFNSTLELREKTFPLGGKKSEAAAMAAECARAQGKFEDYKKALFSAIFEQSRDIFETSELKKIAAEQQILDLNAFNSCIDENRTRAIVESDANTAKSYKLFTAPSFVIDCIFTVPGAYDLKQKICALHPDFNACKQ